ERPDRGEIVGPPNLARGVPFNRQPRVLRLHAFTVVLDPHLLLASELDVDAEATGSRVDGVLDELLDDRRWTLDDLACGDLIGELRGKTGDLSHEVHVTHRGH